MPPKGSRKPKAATNKVAPEKEAEPAAKAPASRKRKPVDEDLAAVEHTTHAKVICGARSAQKHAPYALLLLIAAV